MASQSRASHLLDVLLTEFGPSIERDPLSFQRKFRKMAGSAFAFYRGSAASSTPT
ncbi:hypothetical protein [Nonomuraea recticatena]|uniref:hypothetical protein n=1 Tax=Nonomuraea recticatena TaxID=46178 RepID=UPI0036145FAA